VLINGVFRSTIFSLTQIMNKLGWTSCALIYLLRGTPLALPATAPRARAPHRLAARQVAVAQLEEAQDGEDEPRLVHMPKDVLGARQPCERLLCGLGVGARAQLGALGWVDVLRAEL